jgi:catalase
MSKENELKKKLTTVAGVTVVESRNTMTAGVRGLALPQDVWFLQNPNHCDHEVMPEPSIHASGYLAFGTFK